MEKILEQAKNIIFDFGGVIIKIDFELTYKAFEKLGISGVREWFRQNSQTELFSLMERGLISPKVFRKELCEIAGKKISEKEFDIAWNAMLLDIPKERADLLKKLRNKYRIFLLSNTNKIHYDFYLPEFQTKTGLNSFEDLFEKAWFSHQTGLIKPYEETFSKLINSVGLNPEETVFIDDTFIHIEGAEKTGLKTIYLNLEKGMDITQLF